MSHFFSTDVYGNNADFSKSGGFVGQSLVSKLPYENCDIFKKM